MYDKALTNKIHESIQALDPKAQITLIDETHKHASHQGFIPGKRHYVCQIQSKQLAQLPRIKAHRIIFQAIDHLQPEIHAFSIVITE